MDNVGAIKYHIGSGSIMSLIIWPIIFIIWMVVITLIVCFGSDGQISARVGCIIVCSISIIIGIKFLYNGLKILKLKKYKENGGGIVKQLTVTGIKTSYHGKNRIEYYNIEAKEGDDVYYSLEYSVGKIGGTSVQMLSEIYQKYGFEFDETESRKQDVLRECDRRILEKKYESESEGMIKRVLSQGGIMSMQSQRKIVEHGYESEYWEVNGHRITIGDTVYVYIDPDNPKYYWVDIDFLFEK